MKNLLFMGIRACFLFTTPFFFENLSTAQASQQHYKDFHKEAAPTLFKNDSPMTVHAAYYDNSNIATHKWTLLVTFDTSIIEEKTKEEYQSDKGIGLQHNPYDTPMCDVSTKSTMDAIHIPNEYSHLANASHLLFKKVEGDSVKVMASANSAVIQLQSFAVGKQNITSSIDKFFETYKGKKLILVLPANAETMDWTQDFNKIKHMLDRKVIASKDSPHAHLFQK